MCAMRVLMLRHAQSVSNAHKEAASLCLTRRATCSPIAVTSRRETRRAALADREITRLISSPMRRAQETAAPIVRSARPRDRDGRRHLRAPRGGGIRRACARGAEAQALVGVDGRARRRSGLRAARRRLVRGNARAHPSLSQREWSPRRGVPLVVTHGIFLRFLLIDILLGDRFGPADAARLWQLRTVNCGLSAFDFRAPRRPVDHDTDDWQCAMWMEPLGG